MQISFLIPELQKKSQIHWEPFKHKYVLGLAKKSQSWKTTAGCLSGPFHVWGGKNNPAAWGDSSDKNSSWWLIKQIGTDLGQWQAVLSHLVLNLELWHWDLKWSFTFYLLSKALISCLHAMPFSWAKWNSLFFKTGLWCSGLFFNQAWSRMEKPGICEQCECCMVKKCFSLAFEVSVSVIPKTLLRWNRYLCWGRWMMINEARDLFSVWILN